MCFSSALLRPLLLASLCLAASAASGMSSITSSSVTYSILEEQPPMILVGNIARDGKLPPNRRYVYRLRKSSPFFQLDSRTGDLRTRLRIDLESICRSRRPGCDTIHLIANAYKATESDSLPLSPLKAYVNVAVVIRDRNDHAPVFRLPSIGPLASRSEQFYKTELTERISLPQATKVELPRAVDGDYSKQFNRLTYSLLGFSDTFDLVSNQRPVLVLLKDLDRETTPNYTLKVQAQDSEGKKGELEVRIVVKDLDDNPPKFQHSLYRVTVSENTPRDAVIFNVTAYDPDEHELTYGIDPLSGDAEQDQTERSLFQVERNGDIRLIGKLDFEVGQEYTIIVRAVSANFQSSTRVNIRVKDENDNKPKFLLNPTDLKVVENRPSHEPIGDVTVTDSDSGVNGEVTCYEEKPNGKIRFKAKRVDYNGGAFDKDVMGGFRSKMSGPFSGVRSVKKFDIQPEVSFDREATPRIHARLICTDGGSPPLSRTLEAIIEVVDVNDNPPVFRQKRYYKAVKENNNRNAFILQVNATDDDKGQNALVTYSLPEVGDATAFRIDKRSGKIIATEILDRERKSQYVFKVTAQDQAKENALSSTTEVVINVLDTNDHKPELLGGTHFNISENMQPNTFIANLKARDLDLDRNGQVVFSMDRQLAHNYFILRQNGSLYSSEMFDREREGDPKNLCIRILMTDRALEYPLTGQATICVSILDMNDNPPQFTYPSNNSTIFIGVNEPPGKLIANVRAVDPDEGKNSEVRYELGNNLDGLFTIGTHSGDLRLAATRHLMPEDIRVHKITVTAWDNGATSLSNSIILRIAVTQSTETDLSGLMSGRRNVIIVIILSSVSGVLALVLITAIICMVRPCRTRSSHRRNDYAASTDSYAAAKPGWCSPLDEVRLHGHNEYSATASPAMSDQPLSLCVDSARPDATLFKHSLTCPRSGGDPKACTKHSMDTMRSVRQFETLERAKAPLNNAGHGGRHMDADGQQSDSGRGASDEDLSATLAQHAAAQVGLHTFHPGCPATLGSGGTLRTRHLMAGPATSTALAPTSMSGAATLGPRQLTVARQCASPSEYTRPGSAMGSAGNADSYELLRRRQPPVPPTSAAGATPGGPPVSGTGRVDAEQLVEEIDQLFFKDMML